MNEKLPDRPVFRDIVEHNDEVTCCTVKNNEFAMIAIPNESGGQSVFLTVDNARFVRDWLNKVLP